jgi:2-iminobutanoate/2-iminopropanoate deaminase
MIDDIFTTKAPAAIGPYSQAVRCGDWLFVSGQIPIDPSSGQMVAADVETQTLRVLDNLEAILAAAGCSFSHVVRTTIYLVDLGHFAVVNEIYGRRIGKPAPARSTIQVAGLPRGALVEIDAIACSK